MGQTAKAALLALQSAQVENSIAVDHVDLCGRSPPIDKLDASFGVAIPGCRRLALSTNNIDRVAGLIGLDQLEILSLGRNCLKRLDGLDAVAPTLRELWVSYNLLEKLAGVEKCTSLRVLFASNNKVKDWGEVARLAALPCLEDLLLVGNPVYNEHRDAGTLPQYRIEVLRCVPGLKKLDGELISAEERAALLQQQGNKNAPTALKQ